MTAVILAGSLSCSDRREEGRPTSAAVPAPDAAATDAPDDQPSDMPRGHGRWNKLRLAPGGEPLTPEQQKAVDRLQTLGYVSGSKAPTTQEVITVHVPDKVYAGLNLFVSGHAPEAVLVDMQGRELHRWHCGMKQAWPKAPLKTALVEAKDYWRRAHLLDNGDILAILEGIGILKLDKDSNLIWAQLNGAHHDLDVMPDGEIYVLTRESGMLSGVEPKVPVMNDNISVLDARGKETRRVSILKCFMNSKLPESMLWCQDLFHTNTLDVLDEREAKVVPNWKPGQVLISLLRQDMLAVVDLDQERFVWMLHTTTPAGTGDSTDPSLPLFFRQQHDPQVLANGNLLLFDNQGIEGRSTIWEFEPTTQRVAWHYRGSEERPFYTEFCGTTQRLPTGNTLITESESGRAFEVTRDKEIAWEFYNPHRAGDRGQYIATLFDLVRLPPDFPVAWARISNP